MSPALPRPTALLGAAAGLATLGASAALGVPGADLVPFTLAGLGAAIGAVALSTPTLLVVGAYLGHPAPPAALAAAPLDAFVRTGRIALWLGPVLLFFVTAGNADIAWVYASFALVTIGIVVGARGIVASGRGHDATLVRGLLGVPLALGWALLAGALAFHLGGALFPGDSWD